MTNSSNEPGSHAEIVANRAPFEAFVAVPSQGSGPGVLVLDPPRGSQDTLREFCGMLAEEGYVVFAPSGAPSGSPRGWLESVTAAIRAEPRHTGGLGLVSFRDCAVTRDAVLHGLVDTAVLYGVRDLTWFGAEPDFRTPVTAHLDGGAPAAASAPPQVSIFAYPDCCEGFAVPGNPHFDPAFAGTAYSRTITALKRAIGPHYNLEDLWEHHLACEFTAKDAAAAIETMVAEPYVNHVPTMTGGVGRDLLERFYKHHFVNQVPKSRRTIPVSRTIGADRIVDEKIFCFTHDCEIDWLLPGVAPTGRYVEIPLVGIITFRGDKLVNEHIYWDQASVLVQVGLLDPTGLPVSGIEQARKLADKSLPSNELMPAWRTSEGKPL
jgi:carboxymethylenebutenolidase